MKLGVFLLTGLLLISLVPSPSSGEASQDTAIAEAQTWPEDYQPEEYLDREREGEEATGAGEEEVVKRPPRPKRRRRLRKRPRTEPTDIERGGGGGGDGIEGGVEKFPDNFQNSPTGEEAAGPKRRPIKRRRRPHRRYQGDDGPPLKPLRRRRKGGRRRIRPIENHDETETTGNQQEQNRNDEELQESTAEPIETTLATLLNSIPEEEDEQEQAEDKRKQTDIITTPKTIDRVSLNNELIKSDIEETTKPMEFGNKIFDRKKLFSNSRRTLPITSAVIRKLSPTRNNNTNIVNSPTDQRKDQEQTKLNMDSKIGSPKYLNEVKHSKTESEMKTLQEEGEDEEPNYPKIIPRSQNRHTIKSYETQTAPKTSTTTTKITTTTTTEKIETTKEPEQYELITEPSEIQESQMSEIEKMLDNLDDESYNKTLLNDYILDLLNSKQGRERLSRILEARNMTLSQLLEHRERGSSKFHLLEMFPQKKKQQETTTQAETAHSEEKHIEFPSEEILGSFPKFISDEIEKHAEKNDENNNKIDDIESQSSVKHETREPRHFSEAVSSTTKENLHPTWRVIPNPKLRPVSTRGNYEEIPISNVFNRPLENNDLYLVEDGESIVHHKRPDRIRLKEKFGDNIPVGVKSAIIISGIILAVAIFGFLSLLVSCRVRQKRSLRRAKEDMLREHLGTPEELMASQASLSPVLAKHQNHLHGQQVYNPHHHHDHRHQSHPHNHNRHYYLWRTLRRTFRYD